MKIIFDLNELFLRPVIRRLKQGEDVDMLRRVSLIDESSTGDGCGWPTCRCWPANKVNGVSALHTQLLRDDDLCRLSTSCFPGPLRQSHQRASRRAAGSRWRTWRPVAADRS